MIRPHCQPSSSNATSLLLNTAKGKKSLSKRCSLYLMSRGEKLSQTQEREQGLMVAVRIFLATSSLEDLYKHLEHDGDNS